MDSQNKQIIKHLIGGGKITPLEALNKFGSLRLSARIFDLRGKGWIIRDQWITLENGKRIKEYFI